MEKNGTEQTAGESNSQHNFASFWRRFGCAAIIDGILLFLVGLVIARILGIDPFEPRSMQFEIIVNLIGLVEYWLYFAILESSKWQGSLGKRALGIIVTDLTGNRISFARATGRHFAKIISFIILLIGFLMVLWDDKKQGLHDKLAKTLVIRQ